MRCPACGFTSFPHITVCKKCGKPLPAPAAAPPPAPARPSVPKAPPRPAGPIASPAAGPAAPPDSPPDPFFVSGAGGSSADTVMLGSAGSAPTPAGAPSFTLPSAATVSAHSRGLYDPMAVRPEAAKDFRPAGFWIRFVAVLIDGIILTIVNYFLSKPLTRLVAGLAGGLASQEPSPEALLRAIAMAYALSVAVSFIPFFVYEVAFVGWRGQTPGKMALGLKIIRADGGDVDYIKAFIRWIGLIISGLLLLIGYIMAAFTENKRALHDYIAGTRVVHL